MLPDGAMRYIHAIGHPVFDASGAPVEFVGTVMDVTERKQAEEERQAHLWFLESMDRVNRAMQGTNDLEQMMSDVLDAVLAIFQATARGWSIPVIRRRHRGQCRWSMRGRNSRAPSPWGLTLPVDPEVAHVFHTVRASSGPVRFGPGSEHPLPAEAAERFSIQSMMAMAIYPKGGQVLHVRAAPVLVPARLDAAGRAAVPGDRPTAGRRPDQPIDVAQPARKRAQTGRGPAPLARRLLGARPRDGSHHLVGRNLPHLWAAATRTHPEPRRNCRN